MDSQLYGFQSYSPSNVGFVPQVRSALASSMPTNVNPARCPPGLNPCAAGAGIPSDPLSFGPHATSHVHTFAHPGSPSVHDCSFGNGGAMNTYDIAPDPYATTKYCHDDRCASGVCDSCGMSCGQNVVSDPSTCSETEQGRLASDDPVYNNDAWAQGRSCRTEEQLPCSEPCVSVHGGLSCPPTRDLHRSGNRFGADFGDMDSGIGLCVYRDSAHCHGSPHFGREGSVVAERVASAGAWTQRTPNASHDHGIDQISFDVMSGSYIRQHVPSYTQRPVMNDLHGFGCGSNHVVVCQPSVLAHSHGHGDNMYHGLSSGHVSGMSGFGHGLIPGASPTLNGAHGYPYHGNHAVMGQSVPWDNARRRE
eukprot:1764043-Amphidinium_carterae.1